MVRANNCLLCVVVLVRLYTCTHASKHARTHALTHARTYAHTENTNTHKDLLVHTNSNTQAI